MQNLRDTDPLYRTSAAFIHVCNTLVEKCMRRETFNLGVFCDIWAEMSISCICRGKSGTEAIELEQTMLYIGKQYMLKRTSNIRKVEIGTYMVYTFLALQQDERLAYMRILPRDIPAIEQIEAMSIRERNPMLLRILAKIVTTVPLFYKEGLKEFGADYIVRHYKDDHLFAINRPEFIFMDDADPVTKIYLQAKMSLSDIVSRLNLLDENSHQTLIAAYVKSQAEKRIERNYANYLRRRSMYRSRSSAALASTSGTARRRSTRSASTSTADDAIPLPFTSMPSTSSAPTSSEQTSSAPTSSTPTSLAPTPSAPTSSESTSSAPTSSAPTSSEHEFLVPATLPNKPFPPRFIPASCLPSTFKSAPTPHDEKRTICLSKTGGINKLEKKGKGKKSQPKPNNNKK